MRSLDFSSWQALLSTLFGLAVITLIGVGIRLLVMQRVQQRTQRENRQINERLRTLIAAYKTLGGSFTGNLVVDPSHLRDLRRRPAADAATATGLPEEAQAASSDAPIPASDRRRRIRDAVEAALSDIILLGTEEQVRLAARAAMDLAHGRLVDTAELVVSLRNFIRDVLDLDPVPPEVQIPAQGPARPGGSGGRAGGRAGAGGGGGGGGGGGKAGGGMGAGMGAGMGLGMGAGVGAGAGGAQMAETHAAENDGDRS
ncbi:hypothetical protein GCM10023144_04430 [Pigmentiphaga soli]|uniref:Uncharacterized protein n=1 Tax=Pigmentiphaga soli TaxID=1007095 RepID=A0ABP8GGF4_9BURK